MKGTVMVVSFDIYLSRLKKDAIIPPKKPKLVKRFAEDILTTCKTNAPYRLLHFQLCERNSESFLDTRIYCSYASITTKLHWKITTLTLHSSSIVRKRYNGNTINWDLYWSESISSDFKSEKIVIQENFHNVSFPSPFMKSVIIALTRALYHLVFLKFWGKLYC